MAVVQDFSNAETTIDWLPHAQAAAFLGVHISQYRRDLSLLDNLGIIQRDRYAKGSDGQTLEILLEFRQLVQQRGRRPAAKEIIRRYQHGK